jgi:hypothetical protein
MAISEQGSYSPSGSNSEMSSSRSTPFSSQARMSCYDASTSEHRHESNNLPSILSGGIPTHAPTIQIQAKTMRSTEDSAASKSPERLSIATSSISRSGASLRKLEKEQLFIISEYWATRAVRCGLLLLLLLFFFFFFLNVQRYHTSIHLKQKLPFVTVSSSFGRSSYAFAGPFYFIMGIIDLGLKKDLGRSGLGLALGFEGLDWRNGWAHGELFTVAYITTVRLLLLS